ncbi:MAG: hypothetical protein L6455_06020 [Kiritimatiellae bacterium]|nr:hypothetical protein [Kiritimatiellia bacterium]
MNIQLLHQHRFQFISFVPCFYDSLRDDYGRVEFGDDSHLRLFDTISDFLIRAENKMAPFAGLDKLIDHPRVCFRVTKMKIG